MIRKILVPVRGDGKSESVMSHAAALARRHEASIEVIHCRARPEDMMPFGVVMPDFLRKQLVKQSAELADLEEAALRDDIEAMAGRFGLSFSSDARQGKGSLYFTEEAGRQVDVIKRHGRVSDVIAVAQPDRDRNLGSNSLKSALFHSGRPVLMCPPQSYAEQTLGARIAVAWNGSAEAARAVAQNLNLLLGADTIWILSNGTDAGPGTSAADLAAYLELHDIHAEIVGFETGKRVGAALIQGSQSLGADLMVMGAYSDSHERETVFGGNTQHIVDQAHSPVMLSH